MSEVKIIKLIYCAKERRGTGADIYDPIRIVRQLYTEEGDLFMEDDPFAKYSPKDMQEMIEFVTDGLYASSKQIVSDKLTEYIKKRK